MDTPMAAAAPVSPVSPSRPQPFGALDVAQIPPHFLASPADSAGAFFQPRDHSPRRSSLAGSAARRGSSAVRRRSATGSDLALPPSAASAAGSSDRQFICKQCNRSFARLLHLQRHEYRHVDYRPFECPCCDKTFSRHDSLVRHARLHKDQLPEGSQAAENLRKHKACMSCTDDAKCERCAKFSRRSSAKTTRKGKAQPRAAELKEDVDAAILAPGDETVKSKLLPSGDPIAQGQRLPSPLGPQVRHPNLLPSSSSPSSASFPSPFGANQKRDRSLARIPSNSSLTSARSQTTTWSSRSRASNPTTALGIDQGPSQSPSAHSAFSDDVIQCPPSPAMAAAALAGRAQQQPPPALLAPTQQQQDLNTQFQDYQLGPPPAPSAEAQLQSFAFDAATSLPAADLHRNSFSSEPAIPTQARLPSRVPSDGMGMIDPAALAEQGILVDTYVQMQMQMATIRKFMHENMVAYLARRLPPLALDKHQRHSAGPVQLPEASSAPPHSHSQSHSHVATQAQVQAHTHLQSLLPTPPVQSDNSWGHPPSQVSDESGTTTTMSMPPPRPPPGLIDAPQPTAASNMLVPELVGLGLGTESSHVNPLTHPLDPQGAHFTPDGDKSEVLLAHANDMGSGDFMSLTDLLEQAQAFQRRDSGPDAMDVGAEASGLVDEDPSHAPMLDPNDVYSLEESAT